MRLSSKHIPSSKSTGLRCGALKSVVSGHPAAKAKPTPASPQGTQGPAAGGSAPALVRQGPSGPGASGLSSRLCRPRPVCVSSVESFPLPGLRLFITEMGPVTDHPGAFQGLLPWVLSWVWDTGPQGVASALMGSICRFPRCKYPQFPPQLLSGCPGAGRRWDHVTSGSHPRHTPLVPPECTPFSCPAVLLAPTPSANPRL